MCSLVPGIALTVAATPACGSGHSEAHRPPGVEGCCHLCLLLDTRSQVWGYPPRWLPQGRGWAEGLPPPEDGRVG